MTTEITNMKELKYAQYQLEKMLKLPKNKREGFEELADAIDAYERKHFPYGTPEFEKWSDHLEQHPEENDRLLSEIEEAERYIEELKAFENDRLIRLKERIRELHMNQNQIAMDLDMNKTYLSNILNGRKPVSMVFISYAHDVLKISYEELIPKFNTIKHTCIGHITTNEKKISKKQSSPFYMSLSVCNEKERNKKQDNKDIIPV